MAISPDLLEVEQALTEVNQTLIDSFENFRAKNGLSEAHLKLLEDLDKSKRRMLLDLGGYRSEYRVAHLGDSATDFVSGYGIVLAQDENGEYKTGAPESVGIIMNPHDFSEPYFFSYRWKLAESEIISTRLCAINSKVIQVIQETRKDLLLKGPESTEEFSPTQSVDIKFGWKDDKLSLWQATFTLPQDEHEEELYYPLSHFGIGFPSGTRFKECLLPEWINMPLALGNIITQKPALLGAASYFQPS